MSEPNLPPGYHDGHLHLDASIKRVVTTDFDVAKYAADARGRIPVSATGIEIDPRTARDLAYLWRLEVAALDEMRALLVSWTGHEARVTAFLATWAYERYWLARAERDVLTAAGRPLQTEARRSVAARVRAVYLDRVLPLTSPIVGQVVGETLTAGHMTRMAVQEGALRAALEALQVRLRGEAREVVAEVCRRRDAMVEFFREEAVARIERSVAEKTAALASLQWPWSPLRAVGVPDALEVVALGSIFDTPAALAGLQRSDAAIGDHLPGRPTPAVDLVRRALRRRRPGRNARGL